MRGITNHVLDPVSRVCPNTRSPILKGSRHGCRTPVPGVRERPRVSATCVYGSQTEGRRYRCDGVRGVLARVERRAAIAVASLVERPSRHKAALGRAGPDTRTRSADATQSVRNRSVTAVQRQSSHWMMAHHSPGMNPATPASQHPPATAPIRSEWRAATARRQGSRLRSRLRRR